MLLCTGDIGDCNECGDYPSNLFEFKHALCINGTFRRSPSNTKALFFDPIHCCEPNGCFEESIDCARKYLDEKSEIYSIHLMNHYCGQNPHSYKAMMGLDSLSFRTSDGCVAVINRDAKFINIPDGFIENGIYYPTKIIDDSAFEGCTSLIRIIIPDSVVKVGFHAFSGCTSLTEIHIPDSVVKVGFHAFSGCTSLTKIHIPDSVKEIEGGAFIGCTSLTKIHIPDSVVKIGYFAFSGCTSLTEIHIPDSVEEIGYFAFEPDFDRTIRSRFVI